MLISLLARHDGGHLVSDDIYSTHWSRPPEELFMPTFTTAEEIFTNICMAFQPANAKGDNAVIQFDLSGEKGGKYWIKVADGQCESGSGPAPSVANMTFLSSGEDWIKLTN